MAAPKVIKGCQTMLRVEGFVTVFDRLGSSPIPRKRISAACIASWGQRINNSFSNSLTVTRRRPERLNSPLWSAAEVFLSGPMTPGLSSAADIHSDAASSSPSCWKCGNTIHPSDEIFFCKCGVIMAPRPNMDHFQLFNLEKSFNLNEESLSQKFKDLQRQLHPDKFTQKSETEQQYSADQSSQVNKAYTTLIKPLSRGLYLLELSGDPIDETTDNTNLDPDFLIEIMEINEDLAETDSMEKVNAIRKRNQQVLQRLTTDISMAFDKGDISEARKLLIHLKYYDNIAGKIKELERKEFED